MNLMPIPPRSPYSLIQEDLWPDEFKILVSCVLLNCTTRRAAEKVMVKLFAQYPHATDLAAADEDQLSEMIAPLGFRHRRAATLIALAKAYVLPGWRHARDLPGIGAYGAAAWDIFCRGRVPTERPKDHALAWWHDWRMKNGR